MDLDDETWKGFEINMPNKVDSGKEYGGYLPLETGDREYYKESDLYTITRLNAARYAIYHIIKSKKFEYIYLPYYLCKTVYDVIRNLDQKCRFYSIDENFEPILFAIDEKDAIIIVNYFGIKGKSFYKKMIQKYQNVIFDNTQAFFAEPILKPGIYNVYSPRKFVGVADGSYLISTDKDVMLENLQLDRSADRVFQLFSAIEDGTNEHYKESLEAEEDITASGIRQMSLLTQTILSNIDYKRVKEARRCNYLFLKNKLDQFNVLTNISKIKEQTPMVYPLLLRNGSGIRERLIKEKIYVPQWWKWILEKPICSTEITEFEKKLAENLIPLPIDQRYDCDDMNIISECIFNILQEED